MNYEQSKLSTQGLVWQGLIFFAVIFTALEGTFSYTYATNHQDWQLYSDGLISLLFSIDIVLQIKNRLKKKKKKTFFTKKDKISFYGYISIDLLSIIPFTIIGHVLGFEFLKALNLVRVCKLVKIIKLISFMGTMAYVPRAYKITVLTVISIMVVHWIACGWSLLNPLVDIDITSHYIKSLYWSVTTLTTIGYGDITPTSNIARLFTMCIMILGVGFYGLVIGNVTRMITAADRHKEESKQKLHDLALYMKHYSVPERLQTSVFSYSNHVYSKRLSDNDSKIIADLPKALQQELKTYMNMKMIRSVPIFNNCSAGCLKRVSSSLKQVYFSPGERIISKGELGNEMYIISHGGVEVLNEDGESIVNLHEGQFFGETALLEETKRTAFVRATSYCDLYVLTKDDFNKIISDYPELLDSMTSMDHNATSQFDLSKFKNIA